jgi:hypothetical protein
MSDELPKVKEDEEVVPESFGESAETTRVEPEEPVATESFKLPLAKQPTARWPWIVGIATLLVVIGIGGGLYAMLQPASPQAADATPSTTAAPSPSTSPSVTPAQLDIAKNYGNKYSDGLLPVGDNKYSAATAKKGSVYACGTYAQNLSKDSGGADSRGPWFTNNNTQYDISKKPHVSGDVTWTGSFSNVVNGSTRTITTNDLPLTHTTGIFPIQTSDAAYKYDKNPNTIRAQNLTFNLAASPHYGTPQCMGGQVGVMLTGVALFNAFDAGGRDAGAWEVQDNCGGHPQIEGQYHYHTLSSCIKDISVKTVIGFALDGFPITGPQITANNILSTKDLDECHGTSSEVMLDGKKVTIYHYVMTQDFPYSASCFRAKPITPPFFQQVSQNNAEQVQSTVEAGTHLVPAAQTTPPKQ